MTDYNDGKWHIRQGEEMPVHAKTWLNYLTVRGMGGSSAGQLDWTGGDNDDEVIIAFRVVREFREPREVWFRQGILSAEWHACRPEADGAILFREVME